jgi:RsiW-degrading membrane proteinase PrsW (M82 family)
MDTLLLVKALIALAPVVLMLLMFDRLDVFNLIRMRDILLLLVVGGALAGVSFFFGLRLIEDFPIGFSAYSRFGAPVIEEILKAAPIVGLFAINRLGFKLDAAIAGFAVGAGFSAVENIWYLIALPEANIGDWLVRGFGTAIMHGGATALFAVITQEMTEHQAGASVGAYRLNPLLFLPGLAVAMVIHGAFNQFASQPLVIMAATLLLVPITLFVTLARNDRAARQWLRTDAAAHRQMLADIRAGRFAETASGRALRSLTERLPPRQADEATSHVALKIELVLRAEELILAAHDGATVAVTDADREKLQQLRTQERNLGATLVTALNAKIGLTRNDLWELDRLNERAASGA